MVQTDLSLVDHGHKAFKLSPLAYWVPVDLNEADVCLHAWRLVLDPEPGAILSKKNSLWLQLGRLLVFDLQCHYAFATIILPFKVLLFISLPLRDCLSWDCHKEITTTHQPQCRWTSLNVSDIFLFITIILVLLFNCKSFFCVLTLKAEAVIEISQ